MLNKKKEAVLSLIKEVNLTKLNYFILVTLIGFQFSNCHKNASHDDDDMEVELQTMNDGADYLEKGGYEEAERIYSNFIISFPGHPYIDDAAYRLAYMRVIVDDRNPYFNYQNAVILFQNFIENYPNSRYINACQNWLNLIKVLNNEQGKSSVSAIRDQSDSYDINELKNELNRIRAENAKLKNTLEELQKAIER